MSVPDPRRWPCNGRVAAMRLKGQVVAERFVDPVLRHVAVPVADLLDMPGGRRNRQVLYGEAIDVLEERDGFAFIEAVKDGYTGYLDVFALAEVPPPTHRVRAAATHIYSEPDIKRPERLLLSHGARVHVTGHEGRFAATPEGFVPAVHLAPLDTHEDDPVEVAARLIGTPYLWGGNSRNGIDCSGLVQAACVACGLPCPGDSDQQARELGEALPENAELRRGDLVFWKGHVAWVADGSTILHANAYHMAVAYEGLSDAIARIESQGDGPVTARRRLA